MSPFSFLSLLLVIVVSFASSASAFSSSHLRSLLSTPVDPSSRRPISYEFSTWPVFRSRSPVPTLKRDGAQLRSANDSDEIDQEKLLEYLDSGRGISFEEYEREQKLLGYLERCPIFDGLSSQERQSLLRCMKKETVPAGSTVVKQGSTGIAMYFLESGELDCVDEENDNLQFTTYSTEGEYFGELALAFDQPRSATIRAVTDTTLYRLDKAAFTSTVVGNPIYETTKKLVLKKYQGNKLSEVLSKASPDEILELARAKLQSKKKPVSIESNLRVFCYGAAACIFSGLWSPGFDSFGWPSLFSLGSLSGIPRVETRLVMCLMTLRAFLAGIDTPTDNPSGHRAKAVGYLAATSWFISESNLNGANTSTVSTFNAWGVLGRPILAVTFFNAMRQCMRYVKATPQGHGKENILPILALGTVSFGLFAFLLPILGSIDAFRASALPYLSMCVGIVPNVCLVLNLLMALIASGGTSKWSKQLTAAIASYEIIRIGSHGLIVAFSGDMTPYAAYIKYLLAMSRRWMAFPVLLGAWSVAVLKLLRDSRKSEELVQQ